MVSSSIVKRRLSAPLLVCPMLVRLIFNIENKDVLANFKFRCFSGYSRCFCKLISMIKGLTLMSSGEFRLRFRCNLLLKFKLVFCFHCLEETGSKSSNRLVAILILILIIQDLLFFSMLSPSNSDVNIFAVLFM
jgi:hypothetical protein